MRLISLTVTNFRSITKAHKLHFGDSTVLIGPNNEGKSNILRALVTAVRVLSRTSAHREASQAISIHRINFRSYYKWEQDFPIHLQLKKPKGVLEFVLEFGLDDQEILLFKKQIGFQLSGKLSIKVSIGRDAATVTIPMRGPAAKRLAAKSFQITRFMASRIRVQYIPAIRTEQAAHSVVDAILESELATIEEDPKYQAALKRIEMLQAPILDAISRRLKRTLKEFLPAIKDVQVQIAVESRNEALRRSSIIIDDGNRTHLRQKGDGVQSLAALALMRNPPDSMLSSTSTIIAIEEPESHLHPNAIHSLKRVIAEIASKQQVVVTTHCPLFVDRSSIESNILVKDSQARSATSIQEIREILGVRASDNLRHAELVLLVEGQDDKVLLQALLPFLSPVLKSAMHSGSLIIDTLNGGSNLAYKAGLVVEALCRCHCLVDNDDAGRKGAEKARVEGVLTDGDINFLTCSGMTDSEMEDALEVGVYEALFNHRYRVQLNVPMFKNDKKWSDRLKDTFKAQGKGWDDRVETEVKLAVAELAATMIGEGQGALVLNPHKRLSIDALASTLEQRLREQTS